MIARLIEFSIRNKLLVLLVTAALAGAGIWATLRAAASTPSPISRTCR